MNSTIDFILHHFNASLILLFFMVIAIPLLVWFMLSLILCKLKKSMNCRVLLICYFIIQLTATFGVVQFVKFNAFDDTLYLSDYTTYHKNDIAISYEFFSSSSKDNSSNKSVANGIIISFKADQKHQIQEEFHFDNEIEIESDSVKIEEDKDGFKITIKLSESEQKIIYMYYSDLEGRVDEEK